MEVKAKLRHLRIAPRKVRLAVDLIRGLNVAKAEQQLMFSKKRAAKDILKLVQSAVANAENNFKLDRNNLKIKEIKVDEGFTLKRWLPRAHGRATMLRKRSSHVTLVLEGKAEPKKEKKAVKATKKKEEKKETKKK